MLISLALFITVCEVVHGAVADSEWVGRTFPSPDLAVGIPEDDTKHVSSHDKHGRVLMGVKNKNCDWGEGKLKDLVHKDHPTTPDEMKHRIRDAIRNISAAEIEDPKGLDGDLGPQSYTCFDDRAPFQPDPSVHPILRVDHIPKNYVPWHHCMNESITYHRIVPTYGDHRPLWPRYGEYSFLPKQRWIHSLEHGSIAMLYHPCANQNEVNKLRKILKGCLYQYVITALNELNAKRPVVLVAWGASLEMSKINPETVINFIRKYAYKAPEKVYDDGQYDKNLMEPAPLQFIGHENDVCPLSSYVT